MPSPVLIAVAGPCGSGKTTWLSQFLQNSTRPTFYLYPRLGEATVDDTRIGCCFPSVQVISEEAMATLLAVLPKDAVVYLELGFHLELNSPLLSLLPCHRVAVLPPYLSDSEWHSWADEVILGNDLPIPHSLSLPELWHTALTGQVFDPASLDELWVEITEGAYGEVQRVKGIFELPDGRAFYIDFVKGLAGIEYSELTLPRWLQGRPDRFSGIEIVGWNLDRDALIYTLRAACLSDTAIAQYQHQYQTMTQDTITQDTITQDEVSL
jgi:GTPase SAR1 family protein